MDISDFGTALSNPTRANLLNLLNNSDYSATEAYEIYNQQFKDKKHRESIYRELENLVEAGLVRKEYSEDDKKLEYSLPYELAKVEFSTMNVELVKSDQ